VNISFPYDEGSTAEALLVAFQLPSGGWAASESVVLDEAAKTVSVEATHFSDWSRVAGVQLRPGSATVKVSKSLALRVYNCFSRATTPPASLLHGYDCSYDDLVSRNRSS
jgi:hypothetical protein